MMLLSNFSLFAVFTVEHDENSAISEINRSVFSLELRFWLNNSTKLRNSFKKLKFFIYRRIKKSSFL